MTTHKKKCVCGHLLDVDEVYQQGYNDAIKEYKKKIEFEEKWLFMCKVFDPNVNIAFKTLKSYAEQMQKEV